MVLGCGAGFRVRVFWLLLCRMLDEVLRPLCIRIYNIYIYL